MNPHAGGGESCHPANSCDSAINFASMAYRQQVENAIRSVEVVDDPVIANPNSVRIQSLHAVMWMGVECYSQPVDIGFDSGTDRGSQLVKIRVEITRVDLKRGAQSPAS